MLSLSSVDKLMAFFPAPALSQLKVNIFCLVLQSPFQWYNKKQSEEFGNMKLGLLIFLSSCQS